MSVGSVARGGFYLFIGSVIASLVGVLYWVLLTLFGGPEVVGTASAVLGLSSIVAGIATLGVPSGVQRFMGKELGRKDVAALNRYFWSSFTLTTVLCLLSAAIIFVIPLLNLPFATFPGDMMIATGVLVFLNMNVIGSALLTSTTKTQYIAISNIVGSLVKVSLGIFLVESGFGWLGAFAGIAFSYLCITVLMLWFSLRELKRLGGIKIRLSLKASRECLHAGSASWLPGVIGLVGQQLGILTVFGFQGSLQAGTFFIAQTIFLIVYLLPGSFMTVLFPVLSGSTSEAGELGWRALKLCLALSCPLAAFFALYSAFPLSLIGGGYLQAAPVLSLLALSIIPQVFVSAVSSFVYARGSYGRVIGLSLATTVPQVILYFKLVPLYGGFGAALSYLVGVLTGMVAAVFVSMRAAFKLFPRKIAVAVIAPFLAAFPSFLIGLNWFIGGAIILLVSVLCYGRLGVVERRDLAEVGQAFASKEKIAKASERLNWILRVIYGD